MSSVVKQIMRIGFQRKKENIWVRKKQNIAQILRKINNKLFKGANKDKNNVEIDLRNKKFFLLREEKHMYNNTWIIWQMKRFLIILQR